MSDQPTTEPTAQPAAQPAAEMPDPAPEAGPEPRLSYEDARDELLSVVQRLETGGVSLQESISLWERGEELADICQRWLDGARARLDAVTRRADG